jgi:Protein of unknown function (DUF2934)
MTRAAASRDERIRVRAYHLWAADGRPTGREEGLWERARELIAIEDNPTAGQPPNRMQAYPRPGPKEPVEPPVEPIDAVENQGEFPGRLTDQGERQQAPSRRKRKSP